MYTYKYNSHQQMFTSIFEKRINNHDEKVQAIYSGFKVPQNEKAREWFQTIRYRCILWYKGRNWQNYFTSKCNMFLLNKKERHTLNLFCFCHQKMFLV